MRKYPGDWDRSDQPVRIIKLAIMLSGRGYTTAEIVIKTGVCKKTIRRDLHALEKIGMPLYQDKEMRDGIAPVRVWKVDPHWMKRFM